MHPFPHPHERTRHARTKTHHTTNKQVLTFDSMGDGWSDPFGEATEFWNLVGSTGSWSGNLMKGHDGARSTLCLGDGDYDFSAPGAVSWVSERASQNHGFVVPVSKTQYNFRFPGLGCTQSKSSFVETAVAKPHLRPAPNCKKWIVDPVFLSFFI